MHEEEEEAERGRRARSHSGRVAILTVLERDERELTIAQIRAELPGDLPLRDIHYHLRVLKVCRLIAKDGDRYRLLS